MFIVDIQNDENEQTLVAFLTSSTFFSQDPRFNSNIDNRTGYKTSSILCVPISNYEGEVIGVAQIINKTDGSDAFTEHDVQVKVVHLINI